MDRRWDGGVGLYWAGRRRLQTLRPAAGAVGHHVGRGTSRPRMDRRPVDFGPDRGADRAVVRGRLHAAWGVVSGPPDGVQPAGPGPPRGRTRPGRDRFLASAAVAGGKRLAAARGAWICFQDEAGQTLRPPRSRTWARRGRTPTVAVSGKGSGRVSIAGLVC